MGIATGEVLNDFPTSMVLDDQSLALTGKVRVLCCMSGMLQKFRSFRPILLSFLTYVLLSYFVRLHCANVHTPLTLLSYLHNTEHQDNAVKSIRAREDL